MPEAIALLTAWLSIIPSDPEGTDLYWDHVRSTVEDGSDGSLNVGLAKLALVLLHRASQAEDVLPDQILQSIALNLPTDPQQESE